MRAGWFGLNMESINKCGPLDALVRSEMLVLCSGKGATKIPDPLAGLAEGSRYLSKAGNQLCGDVRD